jgi:Leucine-rich repeat (LRR) protein
MKKIFSTIVITVFLLSGCLSAYEPINNDDATLNGSPAVTQPDQTSTSARLDLSKQKLEKIPAYVFEKTNLKELDVSGNQITGAIQAEIRHLKNLKVLNASNNQMTGVPAEIGQLQNLEILDLSNNQLTGLPYELGNLKNLKTFNISGNNYSELDLKIITENLSGEVNIIK